MASFNQRVLLEKDRCVATKCHTPRINLTAPKDLLAGVDDKYTKLSDVQERVSE